MVIASLVTWIFLNVKHEELATDGPAEARSSSEGCGFTGNR